MRGTAPSRGVGADSPVSAEAPRNRQHGKRQKFPTQPTVGVLPAARPLDSMTASMAADTLSRMLCRRSAWGCKLCSTMTSPASSFCTQRRGLDRARAHSDTLTSRGTPAEQRQRVRQPSTKAKRSNLPRSVRRPATLIRWPTMTKRGPPAAVEMPPVRHPD